MPILALVRHGQSIWNLEDRFTGWIDVPLTEKGEEEARHAGELLKDYRFDVAYTSALSRAQDTLAIIMESFGTEVPVIRNEALNERMYGDLQGLNKQRTREKYGDEIVQLWRRSFDIPPPGGEALKDTAARTLPFYERAIVGDFANGKNVIVVAHGNSNRSIAMVLENLSPTEVVSLELGTGVPYVYEVDAKGKMISKKTLA
ncbi:MAG: 2,3-bisphosphoglycerate-dependent phosphoglycerate mutase [Armatimonadota bacterium]|nr:2,3-bisphosphoglycerate-dependent phosphoglycerate mutase [Armatimonadota bacterium]